MSKKIVVRLTVDEWNALHTTVTGELESFTEADVENGLGTKLKAALRAMEAGRRAAKLAAPTREP